jgi:hypothetical protein
MGDSLDKVGGDDKSPSDMQPAAVSAGAATEGSSTGGSDEKVSASASPIAPLVASTPAGVANDQKVDSEAGGPAPADVKSNAVVGAAIDDRSTHDRNGSSALANLSATSPESVVSKNDIAPKSADARVRKMPPNVIAARTAEPVRQTYQRRGEVDYRGWRSTDGVPRWSGSPPIIYGPGPEARARYVVAPADGTKRRDWMSSAATTTMLERVVEAPGAVLNGGKQALYGILDSIW